MPTPPQHSATATAYYVSDAAFDLVRFVAERQRFGPDNQNDHPLVLYRMGLSRYDLDARYPVPDAPESDTSGWPGGQFCARDYLKPDHTEKIWTLRRLKAAEVARCRDLGGDSGHLFAFAIVTGSPGMPLNESKIQEHVDNHGIEEILAVGAAALRASSAPTDAEKKR